MWLYTLLRLGLFFVLWGLLWVARVPAFLAAVIAMVLSVPLSYVLLRSRAAARGQPGATGAGPAGACARSRREAVR